MEECIMIKFLIHIYFPANIFTVLNFKMIYLYYQIFFQIICHSQIFYVDILLLFYLYFIIYTDYLLDSFRWCVDIELKNIVYCSVTSILSLKLNIFSFQPHLSSLFALEIA